jgi:hypothetical protein
MNAHRTLAATEAMVVDAPRRTPTSLRSLLVAMFVSFRAAAVALAGAALVILAGILMAGEAHAAEGTELSGALGETEAVVKDASADESLVEVGATPEQGSTSVKASTPVGDGEAQGGVKQSSVSVKVSAPVASTDADLSAEQGSASAKLSTPVASADVSVEETSVTAGANTPLGEIEAGVTTSDGHGSVEIGGSSQVEYLPGPRIPEQTALAFWPLLPTESPSSPADQLASLGPEPLRVDFRQAPPFEVSAMDGRGALGEVMQPGLTPPAGGKSAFPWLQWAAVHFGAGSTSGSSGPQAGLAVAVLLILGLGLFRGFSLDPWRPPSGAVLLIPKPG